jgi:hypothetical protein
MRLFSIAATVAIATVLFLAPGRAQQPATPQTAPSQPHEHGATTPQGRGMMDHGKMMDHEKMMAEMKAADSRLEGLAHMMNTLEGDGKIRAMQDVLNELVKNQATMHQHMAMMHEHMMSEMMPRK